MRTRGAARKERRRLLAELKADERRRYRETQAVLRAEERANISPELVPLWRKVRRSIKGSDRMSRTEAFLHYVEEHPAEVYASQEISVHELERQQLAHYESREGIPF